MTVATLSALILTLWVIKPAVTTSRTTGCELAEQNPFTHANRSIAMDEYISWSAGCSKSDNGDCDNDLWFLCNNQFDPEKSVGCNVKLANRTVRLKLNEYQENLLAPELLGDTDVMVRAEFKVACRLTESRLSYSGKTFVVPELVVASCKLYGMEPSKDLLVSADAHCGSTIVVNKALAMFTCGDKSPDSNFHLQPKEDFAGDECKPINNREHKICSFKNINPTDYIFATWSEYAQRWLKIEDDEVETVIQIMTSQSDYEVANEIVLIHNKADDIRDHLKYVVASRGLLKILETPKILPNIIGIGFSIYNNMLTEDDPLLTAMMKVVDDSTCVSHVTSQTDVEMNFWIFGYSDFRNTIEATRGDDAIHFRHGSDLEYTFYKAESNSEYYISERNAFYGVTKNKVFMIKSTVESVSYLNLSNLANYDNGKLYGNKKETKTDNEDNEDNHLLKMMAAGLGTTAAVLFLSVAGVVCCCTPSCVGMISSRIATWLHGPIIPAIPALAPGGATVELQEASPLQEVEPEDGEGAGQDGQTNNEPPANAANEPPGSSTARCFNFESYMEYKKRAAEQKKQIVDDEDRMPVAEDMDTIDRARLLNSYNRQALSSGTFKRAWRRTCSLKWRRTFMETSGQEHHMTQFGWTDATDPADSKAAGWEPKPNWQQQQEGYYGTPRREKLIPAAPQPQPVSPPLNDRSRLIDREASKQSYKSLEKSYTQPITVNQADDDDKPSTSGYLSKTKKRLEEKCKRSKRSKNSDSGLCVLLMKLLNEYINGEMDLLRIWRINNDKFNFFKRTLSQAASAARINLMEYQLVKARVYFIKAQIALIQGEIPLQWFLHFANVFFKSASKYEFYVKFGIEFSKLLLENAGPGVLSGGLEVVQNELKESLTLLSNVGKLVDRLDCYVTQFVNDLPNIFDKSENTVGVSTYMSSMNRIIKEVRIMRNNTPQYDGGQIEPKMANEVTRLINAKHARNQCSSGLDHRIQELDDLPIFGDIQADCDYDKKCINWTENQSESGASHMVCGKCDGYNTSAEIAKLPTSGAAKCLSNSLKFGQIYKKDSCSPMCIEPLGNNKYQIILLNRTQTISQNSDVLHSAIEQDLAPTFQADLVK